jgi:hypothetical protein
MNFELCIPLYSEEILKYNSGVLFSLILIFVHAYMSMYEFLGDVYV